MVELILSFMFCFFFVMIYWFVMCSKLFKHLEIKHSEKFKEMGSPALLGESDPANNINLLKFFIKKEWLVLEDEKLSKLSQKMYMVLMVSVSTFIPLFLFTIVYFSIEVITGSAL